jgi:hypothetical protein
VRHRAGREALQHALDLGLDGRPDACRCQPAAAIEVHLGKKSPAHRGEI